MKPSKLHIMNIKTALFFIVVSCSTTFISCEKSNVSEEENNVQLSLQGVADSIYNTFDAKWNIDKSGIMLYINGPSGSFITSSNITPKPTPDSYFRVASITKTFTAAAIMRLKQDGLLSIEDTIGKYITDNPAYDVPYRNQITIKQLLQHRGGVFDVTNNEIPETVNAPYAGTRYGDYVRSQNNVHTFTFDELVGINAEHELSTAMPNTSFNYSNTGYNILGKIIEIVSGKTYSQYITETFITPLNLTKTYSVWEGSDLEMRIPYINSHLYVEGETTIETSLDNMSIHVTEGNIVSTPNDIAKWMEKLLTGNAGVNSENVALMKEMQIADEAHGVYGLGLTFNAGLGYGHDGAHLSYISTLRYNPDTGITVLATANFIRVDPSNENDQSFFELAFGVRDACQAATKKYQE
ncbi:serine hydrolase domain-containing protein [Aequorivita viscosa]|uniref:CubicO group peptidase, beta-lactamase class C family n=1 Tax=Aequorivita viscosa TaxID=797419 RepID=A0A1M6HRN1_9FLAO|nr:serine hydrolase domain-containing protein [Aequorivita viscosa]SDW96095.1 D-alanyl-D-alanine carboxypeptidase [Aequorivita viscosa]SHJ24859.1 CubicO group peptidase, beta-lactamase class C family [Aequorivita viscosa]